MMFRLNVAVLVLIIGCWASQSIAQINMQFLQKTYSDLDWKAVEKGEVEYLPLGKNETSDAELVVLFAAKMPAPLDVVLEALHAPADGVVHIPIDVGSEEAIEESLKKYHVVDQGPITLDWFLDPKADGTFNVTEAELKALQVAATAAKASNSSEPVNQAVREIAKDRVLEYIQGGMAAISPYHVDGKDIKPGEYLADSLKPLEGLKVVESEFYEDFVNFPHAESEYIEHEFYLIREMEGDRPILSLVHWFVGIRDGATLIAERKFYISHSLDAMHTYIYVEEAGDSSYLLMANSSFTQKVTGMGSFIAHKVGRSKVEGKIKPMLENVQVSLK